MHSETTQGLRRREREQMRTRLGYCHFHMIKQLAIWDASNKVVQPDRSGCLEHNPSLAFLLLLSPCWTHFHICVCPPFADPSTYKCIYSTSLSAACLTDLLCERTNTHTHTHTHSTLSVQAEVDIIKCNVRRYGFGWRLCSLRTVKKGRGEQTPLLFFFFLHDLL